MPKGLTFNFQYQQAEVVSAQRLRFRSSNRLRLVFFIGLAALVLLAVQQFIPGLGFWTSLGWGLPLLATLFFCAVPLLFYLVTPYLDFRFNKEWKPRYQLEVAGEQMYLTREDVASRDSPSRRSASAIEIPLKRLRKLLEDRRVFVLLFTTEQDFFILPKSAMRGDIQVERMRRLLQQSLPAKRAGK